MKVFHRISLFIFIIIITTVKYADGVVNDNDNDIDLYVDTEYKIKKGDIKHTYEINKKLNNYSLYPYLEYTLIKNNLDITDRDKILKFYQKYKKEPVTKILNYYWISHLYKHKKWNLILQDYKTNKSTKLKCMHLYAMQQIHPEKITNKIIEDLWVYEKSRPEVCDNLFEIWLKNPNSNKYYITDDLIQKRIKKAIEYNNFSLVKYLNKKLPESDKFKKDNLLFIKINNNPNLITQDNLFDNKNEYHKEIILHGVKKIYFKDPNRALTLLNKSQNKYSFSKKQYNNIKNLIAIRFFQTNDDKAKQIYNQIPYEYKSEQLITLSVKDSIKNNNWNNIQIKIKNMPDKLKNKNIWQYWLAKAYDKNNKKQAANKIMQKLAKKNNYYGFLAQNFLKKKPKVINYKNINSKAKISKLEKKPDFQRALNFYKLKRYYLARKEWNYATQKINNQDLIYAAMLAAKYGWHDRAIITLTIISENKNHSYSHNNMSNLLFPVANKNLIMTEAKSNDIDPALILAVTRTESHFMPDVGSEKGAQGLMQLMPKTAKGIAQKLKIKFDKSKLKNPQVNIKYGSFYLKEMLGVYKNNLVLAATAYNAGPTNVRRWLEKYNHMTADAWIEMIPYRETRNYTKKVLTYTAIYQMMLNQKCELSDILPKIMH